MYKPHILTLLAILAVHLADGQTDDTSTDEGNRTTIDAGENNDGQSKRILFCLPSLSCELKGGDCYPKGKEPKGAQYIEKCKGKGKCKCYGPSQSSTDDQSRGGQNIVMTGPFGGTGGSYFTDEIYAGFYGLITQLEICTGTRDQWNYITGIQATYGSVKAPLHGSRSRTCEFLNPATNGKIVLGFGGHTSLLNRLGFMTDNVLVVNAGFPGGTGFYSTITFPRLCYIFFLAGRSGSVMDAIEFGWKCEGN